MTRGYSYTVDAEVVRIFAALGKQQRERLLQIFDHIRGNPFQPPDNVQRDRIGRPLSVKRFGEWTVTFWPEHLGEQVHIVAIEPLRW